MQVTQPQPRDDEVVDEAAAAAPVRSSDSAAGSRLASTRAGVAILGLLLGSLALLQCWRYQPLTRAISGDDQVYYFISERAASGFPPHVSLIDHKHQLTALLSAAAMAVARPFGVDDVLAARALSVIAALALVLGTFALATTLTGDAATGALAALALLGFRSVFVEAAIGFRTQLFMVSFCVLSLLAFARSRLLAAGALAACAFLCWQPAAVIGLAIFCACLSQGRERLRSCAKLMGAGLGVVGLYQAYFFWHGALTEQLRQSYGMNASGAKVHPAPLADTLAFMLHSTGAARTTQDYLTAAMLVGLVAWSALGIARRARGVRCWSPAWQAVVLSAIGAVGFTFLDHQSYPDRFFYLPYAALTAAVLTAGAAALTPKTLRRSLLHAVAAIALLAVAVTPEHNSGPEAMLATQREIAAQIAKLADARGGGLWVVGRPDLLAFNRRDNWTNVGMLFPRVRAYVAEQTRSSVYLPLRRGRMPDVVVTQRLGVPERTFPWLRTEYDKLKTEPWARQPFAVYTRHARTDASDVIDGIGCGMPVAHPGLSRLEGVQARDALVVERAALGALRCRLCICDADGSGAITTADALRVLRRTIEADTALRCPPCS